MNLLSKKNVYIIILLVGLFFLAGCGVSVGKAIEGSTGNITNATTGNETTGNQTACSSECTAPAGQSISACDGMYAVVCGNFDADSCSEIGARTYCPTGCVNGACVASSNSTTNGTSSNATATNASSSNQTSLCTSECTATPGSTPTATCVGSYLKTCGNFDADSCYEWNNGTYCTYGCSNSACQSAPVNQTSNATVGNQTNGTSTNQTTTTLFCTDNDGGLNYNVSSNITWSGSSTGVGCLDRCIDSTRLSECVCVAGGSGGPGGSQSITYACPTGCLAGACTTSATTGKINATSTPTGAYVYIDNSYKGITPIVLTVAPGLRQVLFSKPGYSGKTVPVTATAGQTVNVYTNLTQLGTINATSVPTGAYVYVDGVPIGLTPRIIINVLPGIRQVKFLKTGYVATTIPAEVFSGRMTNVNATLRMS